MTCFRRLLHSCSAASRAVLALGLTVPLSVAVVAAEPPRVATAFIEQHCADCHDGETKKGGLDLVSLQ